MIILEIVILSQKENELEVQIKGETHTILNIIKYELLKDKRIETAFYDIKNLHNSVSKNPILYMKTYPNEIPLIILKEVSREIINICDDFSSTFKKAVLNYKK